jgi:hypothetical protein
VKPEDVKVHKNEFTGISFILEGGEPLIAIV